MKEFIGGVSFVTGICSILLCLILRDVRHDVREIKEYLVPEVEEMVDTIYVHKKDTIIQYVYGNEEE